MDLLELWRNELAAVSLSAFVMRASGDVATLAATLNYYEQIIRLFAFDTGFEPLVAIYDGNIRQDQVLYSFFSKEPLYVKTSAAYYTAAQEDIFEQFTDQFVGNFCLIWGLFLPDMIAHALAQGPKALFDSRANKIITKRKNELVDAGDFFKWASHAYSTSFKNYSPFTASPAMWRVYNPLIDLYWLTLSSHIRCHKAIKDKILEAYVKPFIETQKTRITLNGEPFGEARLTGEGRIALDVPEAALTLPINTVQFNSYGMIKNVYLLAGWMDSHLSYTIWTSPALLLAPPLPVNTGQSHTWGGVVAWPTQGGGLEYGVHFYLPGAVAAAVTINYDVSSIREEDTNISAGCIYPGAGYFSVESIYPTAPGQATFHIPPRRCWGVGLFVSSTPPYPQLRSVNINSIEVVPEDPLPVEQYNPFWRYMPDYNSRTGAYYPEWEGWPPEEEPEW